MLRYQLEGSSRTYDFSYREIKDHYQDILSLTDEEFLDRLPEALHLAVYICFIKEVPGKHCLSDTGIIHMLAHLLHDKAETLLHHSLSEIREEFRTVLMLV